MVWPTPVARGSVPRGAIACLCLSMTACEAILPGEAEVPPTRLGDSRHIGIGRPLGLSDRMAYLGLADSLATTPKEPGPFRFSDILEGSGIDFVQVSGTT